jgi:membrane-bound ClpP family serine protease
MAVLSAKTLMTHASLEMVRRTITVVLAVGMICVVTGLALFNPTAIGAGVLIVGSILLVVGLMVGTIGILAFVCLVAADFFLGDRDE